MNVSLAAQVLSHSVASAMHCLYATNILGKECLGTIKFIKNIDKLFDLFNSSSLLDKKRFRRPLHLSRGMKRSEKFCFLDNVSKELSTLKIYNCRTKQDITNSVKFLKGWLLNISSLKGLSTEMRSLGIQKLATRRLNQDCLENFFGLMRRKGGLNDNPSACEFENNYKQAFCCFITIPSKSGANCEFDDAVILNTMNALKGLKSRNKENESVSEVSYGNPVFQNDEFIEQFSSLIQQNECNATVKPWVFTISSDFDKQAEKFGLKYVCGWSVKTFLERHKCDQCKFNFKSHDNFVGPDDLFTYYRAYDNPSAGPFHGLTVPTEACFNYIKSCEDHFLNSMKAFGYQKNIREKIVSYCDSSTLFCSEEARQQFCRTYVVMRLHYLVKFTNRSLMEQKQQERSVNRQKFNKKKINIATCIRQFFSIFLAVKWRYLEYKCY